VVTLDASELLTGYIGLLGKGLSHYRANGWTD